MPLFLTHRNWAALGARAGIAAVFIPNAMDKLFASGTFHLRGPEVWGKTFAESAAFLTKYFAPDQVELIAQACAWTQLVCGCLVLIGLLTRPAVLPLIALALAGVVHSWHNGFWHDALARGNGAAGPGFEIYVLIIAVCVGVLFSGGGSTSVDKLIACEPDADDLEIQWEDEDGEYYDDDETDMSASGRRYR